MKWLERVLWASIVVILVISTASFFALWKNDEGLLGRSEYMNFMHLIRLQQALMSNDIDAAMARNRDRMSTHWNSFLAQKESNDLIISELDFRKLEGELEKTSVLD